MSDAKGFKLMVVGSLPGGEENPARSRIMTAVEKALVNEGMQGAGIYVNQVYFGTDKPEAAQRVHGDAKDR